MQGFLRQGFKERFDEQNFTFTNTGERTPFELLVKQSESDNGKSKFEQAEELKNKGYTHEQIAKQLGYGSKGTVSKLFDKAEKMGWKKGVSNVSNGNETETTF